MQTLTIFFNPQRLLLLKFLFQVNKSRRLALKIIFFAFIDDQFLPLSFLQFLEVQTAKIMALASMKTDPALPGGDRLRSLC